MSELMNWLTIIETVVIRGSGILINAMTIAVIFVVIYETVTRKGPARWDNIAFAIALVILMQVWLRHMPAMTMRSLTIGLQNARAEMPAYESEVDNWRITNGLAPMVESTPAPGPAPALPGPIIVGDTPVPPAPTAPPATPMPTIIYVYPEPSPTPNVLLPPTSVVTPPPDFNPTPSDITRQP